jgi:hypothetical protein
LLTVDDTIYEVRGVGSSEVVVSIASPRDTGVRLVKSDEDLNKLVEKQSYRGIARNRELFDY